MEKKNLCDECNVGVCKNKSNNLCYKCNLVDVNRKVIKIYVMNIMLYVKI